MTFLRKELIGAIADIIDGIIVLVLSGSAVKAAEEASMAYALTINKEAGYVLFQIHGWAILVVGAVLAVMWILDKKDGEI